MENSLTLELGNPNDKQRRALLSRVKFLLFGGARGGGKTWFAQRKAVSGCYRYPGITICIVRKTYPELYGNHIKPLVKLLQCYHPDKAQRFASYNDSKKTITFPNGSQILFRYCSNEKDVDRFQGLEFDWLFIDEAGQFAEEIFKKLTACVRGVNNIPKRVYLTANPGGEGHQWLKRLFVDRNFEGNEKPEEYAFIQSLVTDNKALMEMDADYIHNLEALPPSIREAWLNGNWDIFSGAYFERWRNNPNSTNQWTHTIEPFQIPIGWKIYMSMDWGFTKPFSIGWYACDYDGTMYRIREFYGCKKGEANVGVKMTPDEVFKKVRDIEKNDTNLRNRKIIRVCDPAMWNKNTGYSIIDTAESLGLYFHKGDNERVAGWLQCQYRLNFDVVGHPMFYCFTTCKDFIRTIPLMMCDEHRPEDIDSDLEDHIADEWRYMMMHRAIKPRKNVEPPPRVDDPLDLYKELN